MEIIPSKFVVLYQKYMLFIGVMGHSIFILQAIKILLNKSANDVSLIGFILSTISVASWLVYGMLIKDKVLIYVNLVGLTSAIICVSVILIY